MCVVQSSRESPPFLLDSASSFTPIPDPPASTAATQEPHQAKEKPASLPHSPTSIITASQMAVYTVARASTATAATATSSEEDAKTYLEHNPRCVFLIYVSGGMRARARTEALKLAGRGRRHSLCFFPTPSPHVNRGAYTTARTVQVTKIFELDAHVERLATTAALMWPGQGTQRAEGEGGKGEIGKGRRIQQRHAEGVCF
jgi:hypothetical protein